MRTWKSYVAAASIVMLVGAMIPASIAADTPGARVEGMLIGTDGTPASGYTVHLVEPSGESVERVTDSNGIYTFDAVDAGEYAMGIVAPDGSAAPLQAAPVKVASNDIARRDIRLQNNDSVDANLGMANFASSGSGIGVWWAGLGAGAKTGLILAVLAVVGYAGSEILDDDEETTTQSASEFLPPA